MLLAALCAAFSAGENEYGKLALNRPVQSDNNVWELSALPDLQGQQNATDGVQTTQFAQIAQGTAHVLFLTDSGAVFGSGSNENGQLGEAFERSEYARELRFFRDNNIQIKQVAAGAFHSLFLAHNNTLFAAGTNFRGAMGGAVGLSKRSAGPEIVPAFTGNEIIQIAAADETSYVLTKAGEIFVFGSCDDYMCGDALGNAQQSAPALIRTEQKPVSLAVGFNTFAYIAESGTAYIGGKGNDYQLCNGNNSPFSAAFHQLKIGTERIAKIALSRQSTALLTHTNALYVCGSNFWGQLGVEGRSAKDPTLVQIFTDAGQPQQIYIADIAATATGTLVLDDQRRLFVAGKSAHGELGTRQNYRNFTAVDYASDQLQDAARVALTASDDFVFIYENVPFSHTTAALSAGQICAIAFGALAGVAVVVGIVFAVLLKRKRSAARALTAEECDIALI